MKMQISVPDLDVITSLKEPQISLSMPYLEQDDYEPFWISDKKNHEWVTEHHKNSNAVGTWEGLTLYHVHTRSNVAYYYMLDADLVVYAVRYKTESVRNLKAMCQTSVWRDKEHVLTTSVASYVFFKKLLPAYGAIISDRSQSMDGKAFWIRRSAEALRLGYSVYIVNMVSVDISVVQHIDLSDRKWSKRVWSSTDKEFQHIRLLITMELL